MVDDVRFRLVGVARVAQERERGRAALLVGERHRIAPIDGHGLDRVDVEQVVVKSLAALFGALRKAARRLRGDDDDLEVHEARLDAEIGRRAVGGEARPLRGFGRRGLSGLLKLDADGHARFDLGVRQQEVEGRGELIGIRIRRHVLRLRDELLAAVRVGDREDAEDWARHPCSGDVEMGAHQGRSPLDERRVAHRRRNERSPPLRRATAVLWLASTIVSWTSRAANPDGAPPSGRAPPLPAEPAAPASLLPLPPLPPAPRPPAPPVAPPAPVVASVPDPPEPLDAPAEPPEPLDAPPVPSVPAPDAPVAAPPAPVGRCPSLRSVSPPVVAVVRFGPPDPSCSEDCRRPRHRRTTTTSQRWRTSSRVPSSPRESHQAHLQATDRERLSHTLATFDSTIEAGPDSRRRAGNLPRSPLYSYSLLFHYLQRLRQFTWWPRVSCRTLVRSAWRSCADASRRAAGPSRRLRPCRCGSRSSPRCLWATFLDVVGQGEQRAGALGRRLSSFMVTRGA